MLACDVGNAGTRLKRCGENLKPLRLAPSPPTLRPRKHRDLTQRPLLSSLSRALLRPVAIATGKAAVTEGVLCELAEEGLAEEAQAWLNGFTVAAGASFRDWASKSDQNLAAARSELRRAITAREARLAAAEVLAGLHKQLADAVFASTRDRQWADLFLRSWKGKCDSPAALKDILALLKKSRR